jgi:hypothetical protein
LRTHSVNPYHYEWHWLPRVSKWIVVTFNLALIVILSCRIIPAFLYKNGGYCYCIEVHIPDLSAPKSTCAAISIS